MFLFRGGGRLRREGLAARTLWEGGSELEGGRLVPPGEREGQHFGRSVGHRRSVAVLARGLLARQGRGVWDLPP